MSDRPLVTIGLPVYNGATHLSEALQTLLAQDYPHCEILVSDNASTDETQAICAEVSAKHPQMRYVRNPVNVGPIRNFSLVLERARGKYFMWAAHDDRWNSCFVSRLVAQMEAHPAAVLATPAILHMDLTGTLCNQPPDRPARGPTAAANFRQLLEDHAPSWIYGVWNTAWLRRYLCELVEYPLWGGDVLWLADIALRERIVGDQEALLFKRHRRSGYAPKNARQQIAFWTYMTWHLLRICQRRVPRILPRLGLMASSCEYVYRLCIRRSNLLRTLWRVQRTLALAAAESLWAMLISASQRLRPASAAPSPAPDTIALPVAEPKSSHEPQPGRRSA